MPAKVINIFKNRIDKRLTRMPFHPDMNINLTIDDVDVSAINFIIDYQCLGHQDSFSSRLAITIYNALTVGHFLLENGLLNIDGNFRWHQGQQYSRKITFDFQMRDMSFPNLLHNTFKSRNFSLDDTIEIAYNNYIETFVDFFNEEQSIVQFSSKDESKEDCIACKNYKMNYILGQYQKYNNAKLGFVGSKDDINDWGVLFYEKEKLKIV